MNRQKATRIKVLSFLLAIVLCLTVLGGTVFAAPAQKDSFSRRSGANLSPPPGKTTPWQDRVAEYPNPKQAKAVDLSDKPPLPETRYKPKARSTKGKQYPMSYLKTLSHDQLVDLLVTITWRDIPDLFQFNRDSRDFYGNEKRVQALIDALQQRGGQYTTKDDKGIPTLVEVLRSGFYLGFYHNELGYLNERSFHDRCLPALRAIAQNPYFSLGTKEQDQVVYAYGKLIGNASSDADTVNRATGILTQYRMRMDEYLPENSKGDAVYSLMSGINYDIESYMSSTGKTPEETMWFGKIDPFIGEIGKYALLGNPTKENVWLINNGIYFVGLLGKLHSHSTEGLRIVTDAIHRYPYLTEPYFTALFQIRNNYEGKDYNGNTVDVDKAKKDGKDYYLPEVYTFDNGKFVIRSGERVTPEKIQRLYWAAKEVKAQFHRTVGNDKELESGNADEIMNVVLYNNPNEYKMNRFLYEYDTNNGGIYIEKIGTFFTYERTPKDSIFSLEELFRHEFTHYLQGRYLVPGLFGEGPFYENERITWMDEGNAEFLAGSTRVDNILPRKTVVKRLSSDPAQRYTVAQTLHARYGSWDFYNYAFALQSYMYNHDFNMLKRLGGYVKGNDVSGYDRYIEQLSGDTNLNRSYQRYMQYLLDNQDQWTVPRVSDDYLVSHPYKSRSQVYAQIASVARLKEMTTTEQQSQFFRTFTVKGTYTGSTSRGELPDWEKMNREANQMLKKLEANSWSGYKTLTSYFTNYRVGANHRYQFDITFHGILTDTARTYPRAN
ncbi:collagenase [Salinithrix halophila]|uniref:microbial collagenase n=1 Tax=Salinithrix halophila TaxID=1485204 RepID=A0ABV8JEW5_9BACL